MTEGTAHSQEPKEEEGQKASGAADAMGRGSAKDLEESADGVRKFPLPE